MGKSIIIKGADFTVNAVEQIVKLNILVGGNLCQIEYPLRYDVRYTIDGSDPTSSSQLYSAPFAISDNDTIKASLFIKDGTESVGRVVTKQYVPTTATIGKESFFTGRTAANTVGAPTVSSNYNRLTTGPAKLTSVACGVSGVTYIHVGHLDQNDIFIPRAAYNAGNRTWSSEADVSDLDIHLNEGELIVMSDNEDWQSSIHNYGVTYSEVGAGGEVNFGFVSVNDPGKVKDRTDINVTMYWKLKY